MGIGKFLPGGRRPLPAPGAPPPYSPTEQAAAAPDAVARGSQARPHDSARSARSAGAVPPSPAQVHVPGVARPPSAEQLVAAARLLWHPSVVRVVSGMSVERSSLLLRALVYLSPSLTRLDAAAWREHVPATLAGLASLPGDRELEAFTNSFEVLAGPDVPARAADRLALLAAILAVPPPRRDVLVRAARWLAEVPDWAGYPQRQELVAQLVPHLAVISPERVEALVSLLGRCLPPLQLDRRLADHIRTLSTLPLEQFLRVMKVEFDTAAIARTPCDRVLQAASLLGGG